ncbi:MAG: GntR family transcriptional regulator [Rhodobacteraceae bacterium]|nr:GntR family transcriptional regulator [Paracoccaceae bacterium]
MRAAKATRTSFLDVRAAVLARIRARVWPPGALLPTEHDLAAEFGCARATVNRALRALSDEGVIDRKRKSGTRVRMVPVRKAKFEISVVRHLVEETNATYRYALVSRRAGPCPAWLAARLDLPGDHPMLHLRCMHYADNRPFQFEERWVNTEAVPAILTADLSVIGPNEWLLGAVPFTDAEIAMSAEAADAPLAEFLETAVGVPLFQLERITWLQGAPVTFVRMSHHPGYRMSTRY